MVGKVFGVGLNDVAPISENGRHFESYTAWKNMLKRCYDLRWQEKNPTYKGCSVCDAWLVFSSFKKWFDINGVTGWQIDKDLLTTGNKIYSPDRCVFVPKSLNTFLTAHGAHRGAYPIGAHYHKDKRKFMAQISVDGVREQIGAYDSPREAHLAWFNRKIELAYEYKELCDSIDPRLFEGVLRKIQSMKEV
ncbi:hypothetical protein ABXH80_004104 [Salmonella enterica]|uniref:hypothetical protein n=1 Tax=Salmonella enterica TaxID=28901 RepID=UPI0033153653|nr:hypothetical protein [Salmonella enterica]